MRIIDILNKMVEGTLEDGFEFRLFKDIYTYNKETNNICNEYGTYIGNIYRLEAELNDEVEVIEDVKEIEEIDISTKINSKNMKIRDLEILVHNCEDKINELVQAVNELRKKGSDKR